MTTLFLVKDFPPDIGGVQSVLGRLSLLWPGRVCVVACRTPGDKEHDAEFEIEVRRIPSYAALPKILAVPLRQLAFLFAVAKLWREAHFERIVCGYLEANGPIAWLWKKLFRVPFVVMTYGMELLRAKRSPAAFVWRRILTDAEAVATIAQVGSDFLARFAPGARAVKIPLGCRPDAGTDLVLHEPYRGVRLADRRVILSVGRLITRKGIDTALQALAILAADRDDLVYVVAGDGPDRDRLQRMAADLGLADRVVFPGVISRDELRSLYARADLFVMPNRQIGEDIEGFGIVFIEAGASGVPVVGGRSGGVPEVVRDGHNGFLADPADPRDVAEKMTKILDDRELAEKMGREGKRLAREVYTFENMARTLTGALGLPYSERP